MVGSPIDRAAGSVHQKGTAAGQWVSERAEFRGASARQAAAGFDVTVMRRIQDMKGSTQSGELGFP
jgi:hypothetical protein